MHVPLLDLTLQYRSLKNELLPSLHTLFDEQRFILGPVVEQCEEALARYCATAHAVGVNSGSDALLLALMALDIKPGDRVITTPYTFYATVGSICRLGARPVFADIDPDTCNIDPQKCREAYDRLSAEEKKRVRAVMPVHLYGRCADMGPILSFADSLSLPVIEDAAQAIGASCPLGGKEKKAGSMGAFGCLSFFPSKNLGCFGDAGMILTRSSEASEKLRALRMHGETERYYHRYIGMNGRLDALQAAVLLTKLRHLDEWNAQRNSNACVYSRLFADAGLLSHITTPSISSGCSHVFNQYVIRAPKRDALLDYLQAHNIGCAVYYPLPLHLQECFSFLGYRRGDFPESERASRETLALPIYPELTREQLTYVVETIASFYNR